MKQITGVLVLTLAGTLLGCSSQPELAAEGDEPEAIAVSLWNDDLELFMEYPPLQPGVPAKFAVHLTNLKTFEPVREGPVDFSIESGSGASSAKVSVADPTRPGIFGPELTFPSSGKFRLLISVRSPVLNASISAEGLEVGEQPAEEGASAGDSGAISYLKEQQWQLPFATRLAQRRSIRESVAAPATVIPKAGREAVIISPISGRFLASSAVEVGDRIPSGRVLGWVEHLASEKAVTTEAQVQTSLALARLDGEFSRAEAEVAQAEQELRLARLELERARRLFEIQAVPQRRLEGAEAAVEIHETALKAATRVRDRIQTERERLEHSRESSAPHSRVELEAPLAGTVLEMRAVPGSLVEPGEELFRIVDLSVVWVAGRLLEHDARRLGNIRAARLEVEGESAVQIPASQLVTLGPRVDPTTRTVSVLFELPNSDRRFRLGTLSRLHVETGAVSEELAVPIGAVLLEEDKEVVYVQTGGESFERRIVKTGPRDQNWIAILAGLSEGERIVSEGAYEVALASRSTQVPAHGHSH